MAVFKQKVPYSIKKLLYRYFIILFACASIVLIVYSTILIKSHFNQMAYSTASTIDYYSHSLETEMKECASFTQKLCYSDQSFQLLTLKNLRDAEKVVLQYNVSEMLKRQVSPYEAIFIFDKDYRVSTFAAGQSFFHDKPRYTYQLKDGLRDYWLNDRHNEYNQWILFKDSCRPVLMTALKVRELYVCTAIDLENYEFLEYNQSNYHSIQFGFFNNKEILTEIDTTIEDITLDDLKQPKNTFFSERYLTTSPIEGSDINMFCLFHSNYAKQFTNTFLILFIAIAIIACGIIVYIFYSLNKLLLYPLNKINDAAKHLEHNDSTSFLKYSRSNIIEYQNINLALAHLIDQKIILTNEKQQEAFEKDHAQLQYYQLQTSSHFFANCLKSLYNMLESKDYAKMQRMIIAFSNHLRYVFHDNLKLVPLYSELAEVNDYYNIILLDRVTPFILNIQADETLLNYQVPSLLIQTFLENTAKYNKVSDSLLIFDVQVKPAVLNAQDVMQILISDNGIGYSPDMLEKLNSPECDLFAKKQVGISNLKHRIALIYKTNYQFAFYNKPSGGACTLIYLPLIEHVNHTTSQTIKEELL